jgi:Ca-activated chloride channel family protein
MGSAATFRQPAMIALAWPWALALLPLPLLVWWLFPPASPRSSQALLVPVLDDFRPAATETTRKQRARRPWQLLLASLAWVLLIGSAARPHWLGEPLELPVSGRDLMLAVDLSGSMREQDFELGGRRIDRLSATKMVAGDFIRRRVGDRLGLILFGEQAYLQAPLTFDRSTVDKFLDEAVIGLAGADATAIGDAIGLAVKRLRERPAASRVLILLTDGNNNAGAIGPIKAAELAAKEGMKIYTIGIGADAMMVQDFFGTHRVNPSRDLDEATLKAVAGATGGRYFRARDTAELGKIYQLLDQLEPVEQEDQVFRPSHALYPWPLGAALLIIAALILTETTRKWGFR